MALIIFDFDGVLADTLGGMLQFGQEVCDELGVQHVVTQEDLNALEVMSFATFGRQAEVPEHLVDEFVKRCLKKFSEKRIALFKGLDDVIRQLAVNNNIVIITGNTFQNTQSFLVDHGLDECVRAIFGVDAPGSKGEKISRARDQFEAENEAIYMVGDSVSDIRAAKETSIKSIAVSWGHQSVEKLMRENPDYLARSPGELLEAITNDIRPKP